MSIGSGETREFELKFDVTKEQLKRLRNKSILKHLGIAEPKSSKLRSIYFDTANRELKTKGMSLRVRQTGNGWVQTLKAGRGIVAGFSSPMEIEHPVARAMPEVDRINTSHMPADCRKLLRNAVLEPVFETIISRTTNQIRVNDGSHIEVAFDKGIVDAGSSRKEINEVEIELKSGNPASLFGFAERLSTGESLRFSSLTKADHGYNVGDGTGDASLVAKRYDQPKMAKDLSLEAAYQTLLRACAEQISHNWKVVLDNPDIHGPHQMRIGLRRLRSTLNAFEGQLRRKKLYRLESEARDIAAVVGELRDIDVLATQIVPSATTALPDDASLTLLQAQLDQLQHNVQADVAASLAGDRVMTFLLRLGRYIEAPQWRQSCDPGMGTTAQDAATVALEESWRRVEKWGKNIDELSIPDRHAMRKALKRLRYQTEAFGSFYSGRYTRPFIKKLKNIQDIFGYLNDVAMAEKLSHLALTNGKDGPPEVDEAIAAVLAWHTAKYDREWRKAKRAWKSLDCAKRFWSA